MRVWKTNVPKILTELFTVGVGHTNFNARTRNSIVGNIRKQILMVFS